MKTYVVKDEFGNVIGRVLANSADEAIAKMRQTWGKRLEGYTLTAIEKSQSN